MKKSCVSVVQIKENNLSLAVSEALNLIKWETCLEKGKDILLKLNLGWDLYYPGSMTSVNFTESVIQQIYDFTENIYLADSPQVLVNVEKAFTIMGYGALLKKYKKVKWINLSQDKIEKVIPDKRVQKFQQENIIPYYELPEILFKTQIITLPVLKTHGRCNISVSLKNQWGCLFLKRYLYHPYLKEVIAEINYILKPTLSIVDGTIAMEGDGPKTGIPKKTNLIIAGNDLVAVDSVCAKLMGYNAENIEYINFSANEGLGNINPENIEVVGDFNSYTELPDLKFKKGKNNIISKFEIFFHHKRFEKIVFHTPLFPLFCIGANLYYYVWYYVIGGKKNIKIMD